MKKQTLRVLLMTGFLLSIFNANAQNYFTTTWDTQNPGTSGNNSITIPTNPNLTYSYQVDWNGDNDFDDADEDILHSGDVVYTWPGLITNSRTIKIKGTFPQIYFNNDLDKEKIISIDQWGDIEWESMEDSFRGCSNLVMNATDAPDLSNVTNLSQMFRGAPNVSSGTGLWFWSTVTITDMSGMFRGGVSFDGNISLWIVENVTDFTLMFFNNTIATENYDDLLISWDIQDLMDGLTFNGGDSQYCSHDARVAVRNLFDEDSLVINDGGLCDEGFFITSWKTDNPGVSNDTSITIPVSNTLDYFYQVDWNGDGDFDDVDEDIDYTGPATHDYGLISPSPRTIRIKGAFPRIAFFGGGDNEKILSVEQWGTYEISGFSAFEGASNLVINAQDTPVFFNGASLRDMFADAVLIGTGTGNWNWDTTGVFQMESMFENTQFNEDIGDWDTFDVTSMRRMFADAPFDQDIELWRFDNVTTMEGMFLNGGLSTVNYDSLLDSLAQQQVQSNVNLGAGNSIYCAAELSRDILINISMWTIFDGGECVDNQPPLITTVVTPFVPLAENNTAVITIEATDPEGGLISYEITGGADMALFEIDMVTGELSFLVAPDFEMPNSSLGLNSYFIEVTATDDGIPNESDSVMFEVTIFDVDETDIIFINGFE